MKTYNKGQLIPYRVQAPDGTLVFSIVPNPRYAVIRHDGVGWQIVSHHASRVAAKIAATHQARRHAGQEFYIVKAEVL